MLLYEYAKVRLFEDKTHLDLFIRMKVEIGINS